jgi:hypothetical protein
MTTVPGTSFPFVSVTVNVSKFPGEDELTVSGSISWLKVAVTAVPVTTLSLVFVLVGTFVALLLGLDEITVGSVAAPTRVPGATVTPGSTAAKTLPIPPPPSKAANSNAINIGGLYELSNLVIILSLSFMSPAGHRWLADPFGLSSFFMGEIMPQNQCARMVNFEHYALTGLLLRLLLKYLVAVEKLDEISEIRQMSGMENV